MIKVKIFYENAGMDIEDQINKFIQTHDVEVIDVKFQMNSTEMERVALLLIYKEKE